MKAYFSTHARIVLWIVTLIFGVSIPQAAAISTKDFLKIFPEYRMFANDKGVALLINEQRCVALADEENEIAYIFVTPAQTGKPTKEEKNETKAVAESLAALISELDSVKLKAEEFADRKSGYYVKMPENIQWKRGCMLSMCPAMLLWSMLSERRARIGSFDGAELGIYNPASRIAKISFSLVPATLRCFKLAPTLEARKDERRFAIAGMALFEGKVLEAIDAIKEAKRKTGAAKCHLTGRTLISANDSVSVDTALITYSRTYYYGAVGDLRLLVQDVRRKNPQKKIEYPQETNRLPDAGSPR